jgi:phosphoenolpyruvate carboxykinase (ATP)
MYHFVQGFTAKLAGTEVGISQAEAAFSSCFGAPFMALKPNVYAELLKEKMEKTSARCILLNTGWSGGPAGVADRISIRDTRALLDAALRGDLHKPEMGYEEHEVFKLKMPRSCPGVDAALLNPRNRWSDKDAYDRSAADLRGRFQANFDKQGFGSFGISNVM